MKFLSNRKNNIFLIFFGLFWVFLHVFFLPFYIWDAGILRPWYILNGLIPYRDFGWMRMPLDLFLMSGWYKVFGANPLAYQLFVFLLLVVLTVSFFYISKIILPRHFAFPYLFFLFFLFSLFRNTEEGEVLVAIFNLWLLFLIFLWFERRKTYYLVLAGIVSGISLVTKQNSGMVIAAVLLTLVFAALLKKEALGIFLKRVLVFLLGVLLPVLSVSFYFIINSSLKDFLYYTVFFVLGPYRQAYVLKGDGLLIIAGYLCFLVAFVIFWKKIGLKLPLVFFLILQILSLFFSLFPSFLSYRAVTAFPLVCLVFGFILAKMKKKIVFLSLLLFIFFTFRFLNSYVVDLQEGFKPGQYLTSYGPTEMAIAEWIKNNSSKEERIINYGSEMIYLLSDRLPKNKYVDPFPYALKPYAQSIKVFSDNPPKIVIYDETLPNDHPGLSEWPFLSFLEKNYRVVGRFDRNLILYQYKGAVDKP